LDNSTQADYPNTIIVMKILQAHKQQRSFTLVWHDGSVSDLPFIWLRDNDPNELHPQTKERTFDLTSVDINISPHNHQFNKEALMVNWPGKTEPSVYSARWLSQHLPGQRREDPAQITRIEWCASELNPLPRADAQSCYASSTTLYNTLVALKTYGIVIIENLENTLDAGERFGDLIGFKRKTNFGTTFDVINVPNPNNLAYTALSLPQHTDLANQESVPGLQFLHCYKNSAQGGESVFTDALKVVQDLAAENSEAYDILCHTQVPWRFHDEYCDVRYRRPVINLDDQGNFTMLVLNPHLADIPDLPSEQLYSFYTAYQDIMQRTRRAQYMLRYALKAGEMAIFDNQRLLHGRTEFNPNSGERHLHGYYIEHNELNSRLRLLSRMCQRTTPN